MAIIFGRVIVRLWDCKKGGDEVEENIKGFTMLELMIVLVLMAIITAGIAPNISLVGKSEAKKIAGELCTDLMTIRQKALLDGKKYTIELASHLANTPPYYGYLSRNETDNTTIEDKSQNDTRLNLIMVESYAPSITEGTYGIALQYSSVDQRMIITDKRTLTTLSQLQVGIKYDDTLYYIVTFDPMTGYYKIQSQ